MYIEDKYYSLLLKALGAEKIDKCPDCGSTNTSTPHLLEEYRTLQRHCFSNMFGYNAKKTSNELADILLSRGVNFIPNIFGDIPIRKWN